MKNNFIFIFHIEILQLKLIIEEKILFRFFLVKKKEKKINILQKNCQFLLYENNEISNS